MKMLVWLVFLLSMVLGLNLVSAANIAVDKDVFIESWDEYVEINNNSDVRFSAGLSLKFVDNYRPLYDPNPHIRINSFENIVYSKLNVNNITFCKGYSTHYLNRVDTIVCEEIIPINYTISSNTLDLKSVYIIFNKTGIIHNYSRYALKIDYTLFDIIKDEGDAYYSLTLRDLCSGSNCNFEMDRWLLLSPNVLLDKYPLDVSPVFLGDKRLLKLKMENGDEAYIRYLDLDKKHVTDRVSNIIYLIIGIILTEIFERFVKPKLKKK